MSESPAPTTGGDERSRLEARIAMLREQAQQAYHAYVEFDAALRAAMAERDQLLRRLLIPPLPLPPSPPASPAPGASDVPEGPETSARTVQNVLFVLGGVLLGTAAIAFTVVAWTTYGMPARVAILATATIAALAVPGVTLARGLRATAETFAAIGLLLVVLDGYAAWIVDFAGVRSWDTLRYAGIVAAIAAAVALVYARLTGLAGPAFVALIAAQPVALLLAAPARPGPIATALLTAAMAVVDALVVAGIQRSRSRPGQRGAGVTTALLALAWLGFAIWVAFAGRAAIEAQLTTATVPGRAAAGAAMVLVSLVALLGAWLTGDSTLRPLAAGAVVVTLGLAMLRTALAAWPGHTALLLAATALALSVLVRAAAALLPANLRAGPLWAASGSALLGLGGLTLAALAGAATTIESAYPLWSARLAATGPHPPLLTGELPVALLGLTAAALLTCPQWMYAPSAVVGGVLAVIALPACVPLLWWAPPMLALAGAVVLAAGYLLLGPRREGRATATSAITGAAVLATDAVLTSAARPGLTALVLAAVVALGLTLAAALRGAARGAGVGAVALAVGLLAAPPAVGSALRAFAVAPWWGLRATVGAVAVLLLAVVALRRWISTVDGYRTAAVLAVVGGATVWPLIAPLVGEEPAAVYSGVSLLLLIVALAVLSPVPAWGLAAVAVATLPNAVVLALEVVPAVLVVAVLPYGRLGAVWAGPPRGVGIPGGFATWAQPVDAVALAILALAGALAAYMLRRRVRSALTGLGLAGPTAVLVAVVAAQAPWPALPAATLLVGLALLFWAAAPRPSGAGALRSFILGGQSAVYIGAGLAGALAVRWSTLTALGVVVVAGCVLGVVGCSGGWRATGGLLAVAAATGEATAAGLAAELPLRSVAFAVLGAAIVALFAGAGLRRSPARRQEALAIEAAATGAAVVALAFTVGHRGVAAGVCAVWGLALATRALVPGITRGVRSAHASAGGGLEVVAWWLLLAERGVTVVEAYTLPLTAVALFAGWTALRARPELRSWVAFGPALLAGFLPTLAAVVATDGEPLRRLALGTAALLCVVFGAMRRRQAPVVVGGVVLLVVALHELVLLWQRLPGWIPLAIGGSILLFLAITYERRRRDVTRIRSALYRMT